MAGNNIDLEKLIDSLVSMAKATNEISSKHSFTRPDGWEVTISVTKPKEESFQPKYWKINPYTTSKANEDYYDEYTGEYLSEFTLSRKCAALGAHIIFACGDITDKGMRLR